MLLYDYGLAINAKKVRVYLAEKGLSIPRVEVSTRGGETRSPEFLRKNPMGRIPVLELDDGTFLYESLAIVEYLEEIHPEPPMIGRSPVERAKTRAAERVAELDVLLPVYTAFRHTSTEWGGARPPSREAADDARGRAERALAVLDATLGTFVAGDFVSIADATLFTALSLAEYGKVDLALEERPRVSAWYAMFRKRPSARA